MLQTCQSFDGVHFMNTDLSYKRAGRTMDASVFDPLFVEVGVVNTESTDRCSHLRQIQCSRAFQSITQ